MVAAAVGSLYNASNVVVGEAVGYIAPANTPLPADSSVLFDSTNWIGKTLTITGVPTGGTFTITVGNKVTSAIAYNATAATVQVALVALSTVGAGGAAVTGGPLPGTPLVITLLGTAVYLPMSVTASLTGGTAPAAALTGGLWTPAGGTEQGWRVTFNKNVSRIAIEEQSSPVNVGIASQEVMFDAALAEDVAQVMMWAVNMSRVTTAVGTGQPGKDRLTLSDALVHYAVALETSNTFGLARRYYVPDTTQATNSATAFRRAAAARSYSVSFQSVCQSSAIIIDELWQPGN